MIMIMNEYHERDPDTVIVTSSASALELKIKTLFKCVKEAMSFKKENSRKNNWKYRNYIVWDVDASSKIYSNLRNKVNKDLSSVKRRYNLLQRIFIYK